MTLDKRLQLAYPTGTPDEMAQFLKGEPVANPQSLFQRIQDRFHALKQEHDAISSRTNSALDERKRELMEAESKLTPHVVAHYSHKDLTELVSTKLALQYVVERLRAVKEADDAQLEALEPQISNWSALLALALVRKNNGVPTPELAARFGAAPEAITTAYRWARHLAEIERSRLEAEEAERARTPEAIRARLEEKRKAEAEAARLREIEEARRREIRLRAFEEELRRVRETEAPTEPDPSPCPVCKHEKCMEIDRLIYPGCDIVALAQDYDLPIGSIAEHWNGHPGRRPKIPPPPAGAAPRPPLTAGFGPR